MEEKKEIHFSSEDEMELSSCLLREWWLSSTQALVDNAGSEKALNLMLPHFINHGRAGGFVHFNSPHHMENSFEDTIIGRSMWPRAFHGADIKVKFGKCGAIVEAFDCRTKGVSKEACICFCEVSAQSCTEQTASLEGIEMDFEETLTRSLSFGDNNCEWRFAKRGVQFLDESMVDSPHFNFSDEEQRFWLLAGSGEAWVMATKSFCDWAGSPKALEVLQQKMRNSGLAVGKRLAERKWQGITTYDLLLHIIVLINSSQQKKCNSSICQDRSEGEILECPFSQSPVEICMQYEAFFNGLCEAIDPEYEFIYDRMMTKGDKTCHWVVRRKGDRVKEEPEKSVSSEDLAKNLALRMAKGEITLDEFERSIASLRKHGLVK